MPKGAPQKLPDMYEIPTEDVLEMTAKQEKELVKRGIKKERESESKKAMDKAVDSMRALGLDDVVDEYHQKDEAERKAIAEADEDEDEEGSGEDLSDAELAAQEGQTEEDVLKALKLDEYDDDDEEDDLGRFLGGEGLSKYADPRDDPYINDEDDDEDYEDQVVKETDSCIIVGNTTEGDSSIEVYLFDEKTSNLYVHHEFIIPAFPLCVQWLSAHPKPHINTSGESITKGNFAAVGTFNNHIELWNLDVMNPIEPTAILGGFVEVQDTKDDGLGLGDASSSLSALSGLSKNKKRKEKVKAKKKAAKQQQLKPGSHTDAIMCLAWHPAVANRLASGSADHTVKLWDVTTQQCIFTLTHHKDKVQSLEFNPVESQILLSGSYDRSVSVIDTNSLTTPISNPNNALWFPVTADVETLKWSPHHPYEFMVATEDGYVSAHDIRMGTNIAPSGSSSSSSTGKKGSSSSSSSTAPRSQLMSFKAHNRSCTSLSYNALVPSLFATASLDKTVKVWDRVSMAAGSNGSNTGSANGNASTTTTSTLGGMTSLVPECLVERDLGVGELFTMNFDKSSPFILAAGGNTGCLAVWDTMENVKINERYGRAAESVGLGSQKLPAEYIELQKSGKHGKGLGPGPEIPTNKKKKDGEGDSDSESEDERMQWGMGDGGDDEAEEQGDGMN